MLENTMCLRFEFQWIFVKYANCMVVFERLFEIYGVVDQGRFWGVIELWSR